MNKKLFLITVAMMTVVVVGFRVIAKSDDAKRHSSRVNANIEALTEQTAPGDTINTMPKEPWHYVPDSYMVSTITAHEVKSPIYLLANGVNIANQLDRGCTYTIFIETKSCDGMRKGSWCDQREVGAKILRIKKKESL